jgi:hypothetical protein
MRSVLLCRIAGERNVGLLREKLKNEISVAISSGVSYAAGSYFVGVLPG